MYEFCLLGPLEVRSNGRALELGGQKQRILLAMLLLDANRVVSSDRLIEGIWEESPTPTAQKGLQVLVSHLRKVLGRERVASRAPGYALQVGPGELDLDRFETLKGEGRFDVALALWRGAPLADFAYNRFAQAEIARLEELRLAAVEGRIDQDLAHGHHVELVAELEALTREHPSRERLIGQLLLALYRAGRQADALDAYQGARHALVDELGIEPGQPLRELQQRILRQDPALDLATGPQLREARGPFVGRESELTMLSAALEDAIAGRGKLVLLEGEPGIGKSYLAEEFMRHAGTRGAVVLTGRCWEAGGAPAYWPWVQALRGSSDDGVPDLEEPSASSSDASRFRLFDSVASFLRRSGERRPIVLFLDDLHAADEPSLLLLQFVTRELGSTRLMIVGAFRNVDPVPGEALTATLAELEREPVSSVVRLRGLNEREVAEYVAASASNLASPELAAELQDETEGNPLFVAEMVRLLVDEGGARVAIPSSVRAVIARRIAHLTEECRRILVLASVLGREFAPATLARAAGVPEAETLERLDEAMQARVVTGVPDAPGRLRFAHVLIRDTLYESVTSARRIALHRQVVTALEELYGEGSAQHFTELAHQAVAGSDFERALRYGRRGATRALELLAFEEAVRLYELALDALTLTSGDDGERCELLLALGDACWRSGDAVAAKNAFLEAAEIARRIGAPGALAQAALGYGGRIIWVRAGGDERLVPLLEEALRVVGSNEPDLRARLLARLAGALRDEPTRDRRDELSKEAVALARQSGDASALAYALGARAHAIAAPDTAEELLSIGSELCETAAEIGDRERVVAGLAVRTLGALMLGDLRSAERDAAANRLAAEEIKQGPQLWDAASTRAMFALAAGRLAEADELSRGAFAVGERALPDAAIPIHVLQRYALADFRGGLEELEPEVSALIRDYPARVVFRCVLAHLYARTGREAGDVRRLVDSLPFDQEWLFGMSLLAEAAVAVSAESVPSIYERLEPWGSFNAVDQAEGMRGSVWRYLGLLAATAGLRDAAVAHFEAALEANERMGFVPWVARTQEDFARLLFSSADNAEAERGRALLERAVATYRELGMETDLVTPHSS